MEGVKYDWEQNVTVGSPPNITYFPWVLTALEYGTKADHQGETRQLTQFPKPVIHYPILTKDPHPHARQTNQNTLHERRTNIPHGDNGLPSPILWVA